MNILLKSIIYSIAITAVMSMPEMGSASVNQEILFTWNSPVEVLLSSHCRLADVSPGSVDALVFLSTPDFDER